MTREYLVRRLLQMIFVLWVIFTLIFFMFRLIPADPASMMIDSALTAEAQDRLRQLWGLDKPLLTQYLVYLRNMLRGDFGISFFYRVPVMEVLGPFLQNTIALMLPSVIVATVLSVALGSYLGWKRGTALEQVGVVTALTLHSMPIYWLAMLVLMAFSFGLGLFPSTGMRTAGYEYSSRWEIYFSLDFLRHLALPMLTAVLYFMASPLLIMRTSMIEVRHEDYLDVIRAKGVPERTVLRHAVRNAMLPVVTYLAALFTVAITGSVLLETVFSWPGMGRAMVQSVSTLDYPLAQATFFMWSAFVVIVYFLVDILYYKLDPRISYH